MNFFTRLFGIQTKQSTQKPTEMELEEMTVQFNAMSRMASLARLGGIRPPDDPLTSWFGGHGVALPSEDIPSYGGVPMFPLLQVNCTELPYIPPALQQTAFFVVWMNQANMDVTEEPNGGSWLLREYASLEGLIPVTGVTQPKHLQALPITWEFTETEAPDWEDVLDEMAQYDMLDLSAFETLTERYSNYAGTKIGGHPSLIQSTLEHRDTFVFQIGSEEKAHWNWVDGGILYFSKLPNGEWVVEEQFY